jgi:hypothetical protein
MGRFGHWGSSNWRAGCIVPDPVYLRLPTPVTYFNPGQRWIEPVEESDRRKPAF